MLWISLREKKEGEWEISTTDIKPAAHHACFPTGLLAFSKLLKILFDAILSNLLKRK